jgi:phage protein D
MTVENTAQNTQGELRRPRAIVKINDTQVEFVDIEIRSGAPYTADTYFLEIPLNEKTGTLNLAYFASTEKFLVKIYVGFPNDVDSFTTSDLTLMIQGDSNDVEINPSEGLVSISGRDLSSRLIDKKVTKSFSNITASELAEQFANENGLKSDITKTTQVLGTFLQTAQTYTANNTTQWDMLTEAAMKENFIVFVKGETLVFKPNPVNDDNLKPYILNYAPKDINNTFPVFDKGTKINFFKNNIVSGNVRVTVKVPYSTYTGKAFHVKQNAKSKDSKEQFIRQYVYSHPGLTNEQAVQKAKQLLNNLVVHGVRFSAELVGDIILSKDMLIKITGTETDFDQVYYIESIVRKITINDFSMFISAKNKPDETEIS